MAQSIRTVSMCRHTPSLLRPVATPTRFPGITASSRRKFSIEDKSTERQPGGQRKLIIGSALAVAGLVVFWLRGSKGDINGAGRGANQEYKQSAEGNN